MRILIVEDEIRLAADIADAMTGAGYVAETVTDGEEAWFRGSTEIYAAIVLDIGLPKLDGLTVLKRWRQEGLVTPVIILTARGSWGERVDGIDACAASSRPISSRRAAALAIAFARMRHEIELPAAETADCRRRLDCCRPGSCRLRLGASFPTLCGTSGRAGTAKPFSSARCRH